MNVVTAMHSRFDRATLRVAFVGYRDFKDDPRFVVIPFTADIAGLRRSLESVPAFGGDDAAEDVAGGLDQVLQLPWPRDEGGNINSVVHVCDAPCHGQRYHDILLSDAYPRGDPSGKNPETLMRTLASRGIDYTFLNVTKDTDQMVRLFKAAYDAGAVSEQQSFTVLDLAVQSGAAASGTSSGVSTLGYAGAPPAAAARPVFSPGAYAGTPAPAYRIVGGPPMHLGAATAATAAAGSPPIFSMDAESDPRAPSSGAGGAGTGLTADPVVPMATGAGSRPAAAAAVAFGAPSGGGPSLAAAMPSPAPLSVDAAGRAVFHTTEDAMFSVLTTSLTRSIGARAPRATPASAAAATPAPAPSGTGGGGV